MGNRRGSGRWGSAWWYDGRSGWNSWGGWDVRVLSLRRASRDCIVSVSERTLADIDSEGAVGECGGCLVGSG